jgi:hypothetical protein
MVVVCPYHMSALCTQKSIIWQLLVFRICHPLRTTSTNSRSDHPRELRLLPVPAVTISNKTSITWSTSVPAHGPNKKAVDLRCRATSEAWDPPQTSANDRNVVGVTLPRWVRLRSRPAAGTGCTIAFCVPYSDPGTGSANLGCLVRQIVLSLDETGNRLALYV